MIAQTPPPPYYAVIFTSVRTQGDNGYDAMANKMLELAQKQKGFLGLESSRTDIGITVSYWESLEAIKIWKENLDHKLAQKLGKDKWYQSYKIRIAKVERDYGFSNQPAT
ncbi:MAG: antibiotic biosynthesis monooxygenase family protein [Alphaproteobacteria bacterium]